MEFVLLWLLIGHICYSFAIVLKLLKIQKIPISKIGLTKGLSCILLGPLAFGLLFLIDKYSDN